MGCQTSGARCDPSVKPEPKDQEKDWENVAETPETHTGVEIVDQLVRQKGQHPSLRANLFGKFGGNLFANVFIYTYIIILND